MAAKGSAAAVAVLISVLQAHEDAKSYPEPTDQPQGEPS